MLFKKYPKLFNSILSTFTFTMMMVGICLNMAGWISSNDELRVISFPILFIGLTIHMTNLLIHSNYHRHLLYLKYVLRHKWFVLLAGIPLGVPFLILAFHDWDKFLPDEWFPYARYFYHPNGTKADRRNKDGYYDAARALDDDFTFAWLLHQKRNKHHWQWWVLPLDDGGFKVLQMSDTFRREMLADWQGAGRALGFPNTWEWYEKNKGNMQLHADTRVWIETEIEFLKLKHEYSQKAITQGELSTSDIQALKRDSEAIGKDWIAVGKYINRAVSLFKGGDLNK